MTGFSPSRIRNAGGSGPSKYSKSGKTTPEGGQKTNLDDYWKNAKKENAAFAAQQAKQAKKDNAALKTGSLITAVLVAAASGYTALNWNDVNKLIYQILHIDLGNNELELECAKNQKSGQAALGKCAEWFNKNNPFTAKK